MYLIIDASCSYKAPTADHRTQPILGATARGRMDRPGVEPVRVEARMAEKRPSPCPNCGMKLPRGHAPLNANLPWLRRLLRLLVSGEEAFRCPLCSCVWKQYAGRDLRIEVTPLGFYRSDSQSLHPLPTGFRPSVRDPGKSARTIRAAVGPSRTRRGTPR